MNVLPQDPRRLERMRRANHLFFATAMLFVVHQNVLHPEPARSEVPMIAQASHLQPKTPPPGYDPDSVNVEEAELSTAR